MTTTPLSPTGPATDKEWENAVKAWLSELGMGLVQRNEPTFVFAKGRWLPVKHGTGWPDYTLITVAGAPSHYVECKRMCGDNIILGSAADNGGVTDGQAERMDALEAMGHRCWIALRWEPPDKVRAKAAQVALDGSRVPLPYAVQLLIPWRAWGALRAAAEGARAGAGKVQASIGADHLLRIGVPIRSAGELRAALEAP